MKKIVYAFPFQLLMLHLRSNHWTLLWWLLFLAFVTGGIGKIFGLKYLFLDPEYMGEVDFWGFLFVGLTFGGLMMAWHITTYVLHSYRFPFLASLSRPFTVFCINNSIIPLTALVIYLVSMVQFQMYNEFAAENSLLFYAFGFLLGVGLTIAITSLYFYFTNIELSIFDGTKGASFILSTLTKGQEKMEEESARGASRHAWRVDYYLTSRLGTRRVRTVKHYDPEYVLTIFRRNHTNALVIQTFSLVLLISLGYLIDYPMFRIPAGASILLIFTILTMLAGALSYWLRSWTTSVLIILLIGIHLVTSYGWFNHPNKVYGINYNKTVPYSYEMLDSLNNLKSYKEDKNKTKLILEYWKQKNEVAGKSQKPKIVFLNMSGGGLRSGMWAGLVMQKADSITNGQLMEQSFMITGASGGMIGATYLREVYLKKMLGENVDFYNKKYIEHISDDLQNALAASIATNDIFLPWVKFEKNGYTYRKDRGYMFETQLNENTGGILDKTLADYEEIEQLAKVPLLVFTPVVISDGRRIIVSPQDLSFLTMPKIGFKYPYMVEHDAVEFKKLFAEQNPLNLPVTSAIRMSATYPYVLPAIGLPTEPEIHVMDAGFRDNFGTDMSIRFISVFKDWIERNTSGVVIVQIRGIGKLEVIEKSPPRGLINDMVNPLSVAARVSQLQDYGQDSKIDLLIDLLGEDMVDVVRLIYQPTEQNERASMSFHLTTREKRDIEAALHLKNNQDALEALQLLLK